MLDLDNNMSLYTHNYTFITVYSWAMPALFMTQDFNFSNHIGPIDAVCMYVCMYVSVADPEGYVSVADPEGVPWNLQLYS